MRDSSLKEGDTRKLQVTGGSTYIISLPKRWVTQNGLEKGNPLVVRQEEDGTLAVLPPELGKSEKAEEALIKVALGESSEALIRKTVATYLLGYNIIHIKAKDQKEKEVATSY